MSTTPLTNSKYEHFALLVARGESPAKAYVLSGYSENGALQSGNRLLRKPEVAARVEELKRAIAESQVEKIAVERAWVISILVQNVQRAMQVEPVRDQEGNPTGQYTLRIPAKPNSIPEGSRTGFRADPEQPSERSDAGLLIVQEVFGLVKEDEVRSEAEAGGNRQGKGVRGKGPRSRSPRGTAENPAGR